MTNNNADFVNVVFSQSSSSRLGGGLAVIGGRVTLSGCRIESCQATNDGGGLLVGLGHVEMIGGIIVSCYAQTRGSAIRSASGSNIVLRDAVVQRCSGHLNGAVSVAGLVSLSNSTIYGCDTGGGEYAAGGGLSVDANGAAVLVDSRIVNCRVETMAHAGADAGAAKVFPGGALQLLNVDILGCTAPVRATAISVDAGARLVASRLRLTPPCDTWVHSHGLFNGAGVPPAISSDPMSNVSLRELRASSPEGCTMSNSSLLGLLSNDQRTWVQCDESNCGNSAVCSMVPIVNGVVDATATCSCTEPTFPVPGATAVSPFPTVALGAALTPFIAGCASPRQIQSAAVVGEASASVVIALHKTVQSVQTRDKTISLRMIGMFATGHGVAQWAVSPASLPFWLSLPQFNGTLRGDEELIRVNINSSMLAERSESYSGQYLVRAGDRIALASAMAAHTRALLLTPSLASPVSFPITDQLDD
jgi:hypothetical protein